MVAVVIEARATDDAPVIAQESWDQPVLVDTLTEPRLDEVKYRRIWQKPGERASCVAHTIQAGNLNVSTHRCRLRFMTNLSFP